MTVPDRTEEQRTAMIAMAVANRIMLKIIPAKNTKEIFFIILNDTFHVVPYDRAVLVRWGDRPKLLGVSGQYQESKRSELTEKWIDCVKHINALDKVQLLTEESFKEGFKGWLDLQTDLPASVLWVPLLQSGKNGVGLWLERWKNGPHPEAFSKEQVEVLASSLVPGYTEALKKQGYMVKKRRIWNFLLDYWKPILAVLLLSLLLIKVPLRVVAPAEVVPKKPIVVAAPIEGIIDEVLVQPGQYVQKGTTIVEYDKTVYAQELKAAKKEVQIAQEELNRALTLGLSDEKSQSEISELQLKLDKAKIRQKLVEVQVGKLSIKAPVNGVAILQNPEEWRGKPVRVGEKIVILGDPEKTQLKAWIPEGDNLPIDINEPINVHLNIAPEKTLHAKLTFIANESVLSDAQVPSFVAEAEWEDKDPEVRLGLKGTAILYGEKVTLLYYLLRKPISSFRRMTGL